jgi:membrane-associated phospholipid phosphatase
MSAGVIAAAWLRTSSVMGGILLVLTAVICLTRVLAGVHHERDVLCGAALGIGLGLLGMFL